MCPYQNSKGSSSFATELSSSILQNRSAAVNTDRQTKDLNLQWFHLLVFEA